MWFYNGLFHLFATASPVGGPHENKLHEHIGWAVSKDGVHFSQHPLNPIAPWNASTPPTAAMSEGQRTNPPLFFLFFFNIVPI